MRTYCGIDAGMVEGFTNDYPGVYVAERPDQDDWYRNWPAFHAPTFLLKEIERLLNLEYVVEGYDGGISSYPVRKLCIIGGLQS